MARKATKKKTPATTKILKKMYKKKVVATRAARRKAMKDKAKKSQRTPGGY